MLVVPYCKADLLESKVKVKCSSIDKCSPYSLSDRRLKLKRLKLKIWERLQTTLGGTTLGQMCQRRFQKTCFQKASKGKVKDSLRKNARLVEKK